MPLLSGKALEKSNSDERLRDDDKAFYCELTKEIFTDYEEFFARTMLLNSTVWTCALTSRPNLTYAEALDSERYARRTLAQMDKEIKTAITYLTTLTKRTCISDIVDDVFGYLSTRYLKNEPILAQNISESKAWHPALILNIIGLTPVSSPIDAINIKYEVKRSSNGKKFIAEAPCVKRYKTTLTKDKTKLFLKQCVELDDIGQMVIKPSALQEYITEENVQNFNDLFVGNVPTFEMSKHLAKKLEKKNEPPPPSKKKTASTNNGAINGTTSVNGSSGGGSGSSKKKAKQQSISNYFTKNDNQPSVSPNTAKEKQKASDEAAKALAAKMLQKKLEREQQIEREKQLAEEMARKRIEFNHIVDQRMKQLNQIRDDLELQDHKPIPSGRPISTLLKPRYFTDALSVLEFIKSFLEILEATDKFPQSINLNMLQRALLHREVAGPLSDIIQVLLGSVFSQQVHEASEVCVEYVDPTTIPLTSPMNYAIRFATRTTGWAQKYFSMDLNELPMDAMSVSELLRIHLLSSGAKPEDYCTSWRNANRGGYQCYDDPGLDLRHRKPHIVRALSYYTIYQLPIKDILAILHCLMNQILSYTSIRSSLEERSETAHKSRQEMRNLIAAERKREHNLGVTKRKLYEDIRTKVIEFTGTTEEKAALRTKMQADADQVIKSLEADGLRAKTQFTKAMEGAKEKLFEYQLYLGSDRAFRTYWLFESLPGLFILHKPIAGHCISTPIQNIPGLNDISASDRRLFITQMIADEQKANDKENKTMNSIDLLTKPTTNKKKTSTTTTTTTTSSTIGDDQSKQPKQLLYDRDAIALPPQELLMCTGEQNAKLCPIHTERNPNNGQWTFISTAEELSALINSLNPRGFREKALREQLENESELILNHIQRCPTEQLQIVDADMRAKKIKELLQIKQYINGNLNYQPGADISGILEETFVGNILEMEMNMHIGHLGTLKVNDRDAWREALYQLGYDMQCDYIQWGPNGQFHKGKNKINGKAEPIQSIAYEDPAEDLDHSTMQLDSESSDSSDDEFSLYVPQENRDKITNYATALLQVAYGLEQKFQKEPFGIQREYKNKAATDAALERGRKTFEMWTIALMKSTSYSQLHLHYNVLNDSVKWKRSTCYATCYTCRRKSDPDKMLLCDGCNAGKHMFCFKPKLKAIPEGDWFCDKCKPNEMAQKKKQPPPPPKVIEVENIDESSSEDDILSVRLKTRRRNAPTVDLTNSSISSSDSELDSDDEVIAVKIQRIQKTTNNNRKNQKKAKYSSDDDDDPLFIRKSHRTVQQLRYDDDEDNDDDDDTSEPSEDEKPIKRRKPVKRKQSIEIESAATKIRRFENQPAKKLEVPTDRKRSNAAASTTSSPTSTTPRSKRTRNSIANDSPSTTPTASSSRSSSSNSKISARRSKRVEDDCLLDNISLHTLLSDIAKHEDTWPFERPVSKSDVPDYYQVIENPMDFAKIKSKLNLGGYSSNYSMMSDVQQIFTNCDLYNSSSSAIYKSGVNLEKFVKKRCEQLNLPFKVSDMLADT